MTRKLMHSLIRSYATKMRVNNDSQLKKNTSEETLLRCSRYKLNSRYIITRNHCLAS